MGVGGYLILGPFLRDYGKFSKVCLKHSVLATCAEPQSDVRKVLLKAEST